MKHTDIPVKKNDELSITIDAVGSEGQGVGRVNGYAIFVPGALAGETVRTHIIKVTASYAVGKLLEVSVPSPDRVQPACPAYPACGGCSLQHLDYAAQLRLKQRFVSDALTRLGGFREIAVQPTLGMDTPWRYRNKGSFPLATAEHGVAFGFFRPRSHTLVPLADCPIQDERIVSVARRVSEWATAYRISAYDESTRRGILRHVMARVTTTGECMAVIVTTGKLPHEAELLALLQDVDSVYHNINDRDTNVIFGTNFRLLAGAAALSEEIAGRRFSVGPQSFLQVNAVQTAVLYGEAVRLLAPKSAETVVDAYCGVGTISLLLSAHAGRVIGIESVEPAVRDAERNAAETAARMQASMSGTLRTSCLRSVLRSMRSWSIPRARAVMRVCCKPFWTVRQSAWSMFPAIRRRLRATFAFLRTAASASKRFSPSICSRRRVMSRRLSSCHGKQIH